MSIPHDSIIKEELLLFLLSEPDMRAPTSRAYDKLARLHPELTDDEKHAPYQRSVSKWANSVQFARLHLVEEGLLYRADACSRAPRGWWALTPSGERRARESAR